MSAFDGLSPEDTEENVEESHPEILADVEDESTDATG